MQPQRLTVLAAALMGGLLGGILPAGPAAAQQSPFYVGVSAAYVQDDNLLRQGNDAPPPLTGSKSDQVTTAALLAGFDQHLGRQRVFANAALRDNRYRRNTVYNNTGYTGSAGLDWSTVERVSGSLSGSLNRGLASFYSTVNNQQLERNIQDTRALNASVSVGMVTEYSLVASYGNRQLRNSAIGLLSNDFDQDNGSLGVRWQPRAQTTLGAALTSTRGRYPKYGKDTSGDFVSDRFKQTGLELTALLAPTGASSVDARLGYSKTRYDLNRARDFSGLTGAIGWVWQPRAKLKLSTRYSRDTGQNSYAVQLFDPFNGFTDSAQLFSQLINTVRLQADYEVSSKIFLTSGLQFTQRNIANSLATNADVRAEGKDNSTGLQLGLRWQPLRSVSLGCDLSTENRTASGAGTIPMRDNSFSCFGQFQLQQ